MSTISISLSENEETHLLNKYGDNFPLETIVTKIIKIDIAESLDRKRLQNQMHSLTDKMESLLTDFENVSVMYGKLLKEVKPHTPRTKETENSIEALEIAKKAISQVQENIESADDDE